MSERARPATGDIMEVLDCDLGARPLAAPGVDALLAYVRAVSKADGLLLVDFDDQAAQTLEAFVEGERVCCSGIGWEIDREPSLRLRIIATQAQLQAIESLWNSQQI